MAKYPTDVDKQIAVTEGETTIDEVETPEYVPIYKEYPNSKIPVAKSTGAFWHNRWKEGKSFLDKMQAIERWDEAVRYYQNDQSGKSNKRRRLNESAKGRSDEQFYSTENIVFANISALLPATYAKNPDIEITAVKEEMEDKARMYEKLLDVLFQRKGAPGMNIKPKMRRACITTFLTNVCYLQLDYIKKEDSSEAALHEIEELSQELHDATSTQSLSDVEGKLMAMEQKVNLLSESGPVVRVVQPNMVIRDTSGTESDLTDCTYIIVGEYVRTSYLRAMYATKGEDGKYSSLYEPTHVLPEENRDIVGHDEEINTFTLLTEGSDFSKYGYKSQEEFDNACRTLVWKVWDKTTRRVLMFNDKDWCWPIWVWDDPYHLTRFYNIFGLQFYTDPVDVYGRSEVMYYLDQQDEINQCNQERARMRHWVMTKLFYDTNVFKDKGKLQAYLSASASDNIYGVDVPQGGKLQDAISTLAPPSTQFEQLFNTGPILEAINRLSSVTPILQASQFKTNTTNKAIESYEASTQTRLDEKIDAIEEILGDIATATLEMCIQFMPHEMVVQLIGEKLVEKGQWINEDNPQKFQLEYSMQIVGGSTLKPTSKVKKEQAMNLGQVLGQFAQASPAIVLVMLKMIERAFNEDVVITPSEWELMINGVLQQIQGQQAAQAQQGAPQSGQIEQGKPPSSPEEGMVQAASAQQGQQQQLAQALEMVDQFVQQMPPELKSQVAQLFAKGVPLKQIALSIIKGAQGGGQPTAQSIQAEQRQVQ